MRRIALFGLTGIALCCDATAVSVMPTFGPDVPPGVIARVSVILASNPSGPKENPFNRTPAGRKVEIPQATDGSELPFSALDAEGNTIMQVMVENRSQRIEFTYDSTAIVFARQYIGRCPNVSDSAIDAEIRRTAGFADLSRAIAVAIDHGGSPFGDLSVSNLALKVGQSASLALNR